MNETPTSDEKLLAAFAHASVLLAFFGPVACTAIWTFQRNKSKYVRFHALQAMGYQAFFFWLWMIGIFVIVFGSVVLMVLLQIALGISDPNSPLLPLILQSVIFLGMFGLWGLFLLGGIVGAIFCMTGRDFRYPIIGSWLQKKLFVEGISNAEFEAQEDNWVSGICHATAILQMWGIITPLVLWFTQKERSLKIRFQALQAIFYQLIALIAYFAMMAVFMVMYFLMFGSVVIMSATQSGIPDKSMPPVIGVILIIFFGVILCVQGSLMLATPIYLLLAGFASIRTIQGHEYKYPILGKLLAKRIKASDGQEVVTA